MSAYPLITVHFASAAVEIQPSGLSTGKSIVDAARQRLAQHLGDSVLAWDTISDRRNLSDATDWAGPDAESDTFYLRLSGRHGWLNRASWKITQTG